MTDTNNILTEANEIIYGARAEAYGPYEDGASRFIDMVNAYLRIPGSDRGIVREMELADAPAIMVMLKLSRLAENPEHYDSWLDIAGYAGCAGKLLSVTRPESPKKETSDDCNQ